MAGWAQTRQSLRFTKSSELALKLQLAFSKLASPPWTDGCPEQARPGDRRSLARGTAMGQAERGVKRERGQGRAEGLKGLKKTPLPLDNVKLLI